MSTQQCQDIKTKTLDRLKLAYNNNNPIPTSKKSRVDTKHKYLELHLRLLFINNMTNCPLDKSFSECLERELEYKNLDLTEYELCNDLNKQMGLDRWLTLVLLKPVHLNMLKATIRHKSSERLSFMYKLYAKSSFHIQLVVGIICIVFVITAITILFNYGMHIFSMTGTDDNKNIALFIWLVLYICVIYMLYFGIQINSLNVSIKSP